MRYQGGKEKASVAQAISRTIAQREQTPIARYVEPFLGGASVAIAMSKHCRAMVLADLRPDVVMLMRDVTSGAFVPPDRVTRERYDELRHAQPSAERGFFGVALSYGGKWFAGFSGAVARTDPSRSYLREQWHALDRARRAFSRVPEIRWCAGASYDDHILMPGDVVYCDPPYRNTAGYDETFDSDAFWRWATRSASCGAHVYVSETRCPAGWMPVWSGRKRVTADKASNTDVRQECLFTYVGERKPAVQEPVTSAMNVDDLRPYEANPRRGDVARIAESLTFLGQYRPIVVNRGTITGRAFEVLAGNHTLAAAKSLGWNEIDVHLVDVDDDTAKRIVLVDNRTNDVASYDVAELSTLLESLPTLEATAWTSDELEALRRNARGVPLDEPDDDDDEPAEETVPVTNWGVVIDCSTIDEQERLLARLIADGYSARALTMT